MSYSMKPWASRILKGFEVIFANKISCGLFHCFKIKSFLKLPDIFLSERITKYSVQNTVSVCFPDGVKPCVKAMRNFPALSNANIARKKTIKRPEEIIGAQSSIYTEACHLTKRMDTSICSARPFNRDLLPGYHRKKLFYLALNCRQTWLSLPSVIISSIILYCQFKGLFHQNTLNPVNRNKSQQLLKVIIHKVAVFFSGHFYAAILAADCYFPSAAFKAKSASAFRAISDFFHSGIFYHGTYTSYALI